MTHKRVLIQTAGEGIPTENFNKTVIGKVPLAKIKEYLTLEEFLPLESLHTDTIAVWGFIPSGSSNNKAPSRWTELSSGDLVLFYGNKHFFHKAAVHAKVHSRELAEHLWDHDEKGNYFEYIYFIKNDAKINIPYDKDVLGYDKEFVQQTTLLEEEKSAALIEYANTYDEYILDESLIKPDEKFIKETLRTYGSPTNLQELKESLGKIKQDYATQPVVEKIRISKTVERNPSFAHWVKKRDNYICQICGALPFIKEKDGQPYAEAHHVYELAEHRIDHPDFMITVCPTCHEVIHHGNKQALRDRESRKKQT